ncbi:MAG: hypothetical protein U0R17_00330 [Acidimicrobiia bacterium]
MKSKPGIFFCGTGTTPGVGIPMAIESGLLVGKRVESYLANKND